MNHFTDQGIILSVRPHGEGGAVVNILSETHGKCGGYVNGAQASTRLRSLLQTGNLVSVEWTSKSDGQLGRFDLELDRDIISGIMDDARAIVALQSACSLIDMFLPEREPHLALCHGTTALAGLLGAGQEWPAAYIVWEMAFLKELGYGIDLSRCAVTGVTDHLTHVSPKSGRAVCAEQAAPYQSKLLPIPHFLQGLDMADDDIATGLALTEYFLIHRLLQQSGYHALPAARDQLKGYFNE